MLSKLAVHGQESEFEAEDWAKRVVCELAMASPG